MHLVKMKEDVAYSDILSTTILLLHKCTSNLMCSWPTAVYVQKLTTIVRQKLALMDLVT